jgi:mannitol/fructose-specific phosphotransferase system IIA component (Ntr-type)
MDDIKDIIEAANEEDREIPVIDIKEIVIEQVVEMLSASGCVCKAGKLSTLLLNREKRDSTGLEFGVAFPHIRSDDVKGFAMAIIITDEPIPFDTIDGQWVSIIVSMVSPTYDDSLHLKIVSKMAELLGYETFREELLATKTSDEVIRLFMQEG